MDLLSEEAIQFENETRGIYILIVNIILKCANIKRVRIGQLENDSG